jgi:NADH:ubiquinone oxidoreductase subunit 3 (subunit A)
MSNAMQGALFLVFLFAAMIIFSLALTFLGALIQERQYNRSRQRSFKPSDFEYAPRGRKEVQP